MNELKLKTTSTDAVPVSLRGNNYWRDTGTQVNGEPVYHSTQTFPLTITVNDVQLPIRTAGPIDGRFSWELVTSSGGYDELSFSYSSSAWLFYNDATGETWSRSTDSTLPPITGWADGDQGSPPPTIEYGAASHFAYWKSSSLGSIITTEEDVEGSPTNYLVWPDAEDAGNGLWSGAASMTDVTIADAWQRAEAEAFNSLRVFADGVEGRNCTRGFLPVQGDGDDLKFVNVWQMSSGGSGAFDMGRLMTDNASWCSLRTDVVVESVWKTREQAMTFTGLVMAWLDETNNLAETGNVQWCALGAIPAEPEIYRTDGTNRQRYWRQTIDLELIYTTDSSY